MKVFYIDSFFNIIENKTQTRPVLDRFDSKHHCSNLNSINQKWSVQNRTPYLEHGLVVLLDNLDKKSLKIPKVQSQPAHRRRTQRPKEKVQTTLHRTYTQSQRSSNTNPRVNSGAPEGKAAPAPLVALEVRI